MKTFFLIAALGLLLLQPLFSFGRRQADSTPLPQASQPAPAPQPAPAIALTPEPWDAADGETITISGKIALVGNAPFTDMVISTGGHQFYIDKADRPLLAGREQQTATITARLRLEPQILANGKRLEDRRVLSGITVINPNG